jgi:formylglycine-generating enzyme
MSPRVLGLLLFACGCQVTQSDPVPVAKSASPVLLAPKKTRTKKRTPKQPTQPAVSKVTPVEEAEPEPAACPDQMALVSGNFCRAVEQRCLEYMHKGDAGVEDEKRCMKYEKPSVCVGTLRPMRFCMDKYEFVSKTDERPITLVDATDAKQACESEGKRLCTESEFTFACEGEEMRPYATGWEREKDACNIDQHYLVPTTKMLPFDKCMGNKWCSAEYKRIDGRKKADENPGCVSPFGIFNLNGNVNEWVATPWKPKPYRAALKGGWWGPVRNRCRAITSAHDETYLGYEVGFRCCKAAEKPKKG